MKAYVTTRDRPLALKVCLPKIVESCHNAGLEVVVVDDGSKDVEVRRFITEHADIAEFRAKPLGMRNGMVEEARAVLTEDPTADIWLHIDADVLLATEAVGQMVDAARTLGPGKASTLGFMALAKIPANDIHVGEWSFRPKVGRPKGPWERFAIFDPVRIVWTDAIRRAGGAGAIRSGCKALAEKSKLPMYLARPQIECQHLGVGAASGNWHSWRESKSLWVRALAVDADTGKPVEVLGFDGDGWLAAALAGEDHLRTFVETGTLTVDGRKNLKARVEEVSSAEEAAPLIEWAMGNGRRLLLVFRGLWQGNRTKRALGIGAGVTNVRACPVGYQHPWLRR